MPPKKDNPEEKSLLVRMPVELHQKLSELSEKERRSLNQQILYMLEKMIEQQEKDT